MRERVGVGRCEASEQLMAELSTTALELDGRTLDVAGREKRGDEGFEKFADLGGVEGCRQQRPRRQPGDRPAERESTFGRHAVFDDVGGDDQSRFARR